MRFVRLATAAAVATLGACQPSPEEVANGDDPLAALTSTAPSTRYGTTYWTRQVSENPARWAQAREYCATPAGTESPTCAVVRDVEAVERMAAPKPSRPEARVRFP